MSRMNNTGRSLTIISQQNGWDPTKIEGAPIPPSLIAREGPYENDYKDISNATDPDAAMSTITPEQVDYVVPEQRSARRYRTTNANPMPGIPGGE